MELSIESVRSGVKFILGGAAASDFSIGVGAGSCRARPVSDPRASGHGGAGPYTRVDMLLGTIACR